MSYVRLVEGPCIMPAEVQRMGYLLGLEIPEDDLAPLADALSGQLASIMELQSLDLENVEPLVQFDPTWQEPGEGT